VQWHGGFFAYLDFLHFSGAGRGGAAFPVMRAVRILKPAVDSCFPVSGEGFFRGFMEKD